MMSRAGWCITILVLLAPACGGPVAEAPAGAPPAARAEWFTDVAKSSGIDFVHFNGMSGERYHRRDDGARRRVVRLRRRRRPGPIGCRQGTMLGPGKTLADALFPARPAELSDRLLRNDLVVHPDGFARAALHGRDGVGPGVRVTDYGIGCRHGRLRQGRLGRSLPDELRPEPPAAQQRRRYVQRRDLAFRNRGRALERAGRVRRLRPRRVARPVGRQLRRLQLHEYTRTCFPSPARRPTTADR